MIKFRMHFCLQRWRERTERSRIVFIQHAHTHAHRKTWAIVKFIRLLGLTRLNDRFGGWVVFLCVCVLFGCLWEKSVRVCVRARRQYVRACVICVYYGKQVTHTHAHTVVYMFVYIVYCDYHRNARANAQWMYNELRLLARARAHFDDFSFRFICIKPQINWIIHLIV